MGATQASASGSMSLLDLGIGQRVDLVRGLTDWPVPSVRLSRGPESSITIVTNCSHEQSPSIAESRQVIQRYPAAVVVVRRRPKVHSLISRLYY